MNTKAKWGMVFAVNCLLFVFGLKYARSEIRDAALYADSVVAAADTARLVQLRSLGDSTRAWQRRIIQTTITRDSLDKELKARPVARIAAGVRVDTLFFTDTVYTPVLEEDSSRVYEWSDQDGPFRIEGVATISPAWLGVFSASIIQVDTLDVGIRIACGDEVRGVYSAQVTMTARDPLSLVPGEVLQDPGVCNPSTPFISFDLGWKEAGLIATTAIFVWELAQQLLPWDRR